MKLAILFLCILNMHSCQFNTFGKMEKNSFYMLIAVPAKTSLKITSEDGKSFSLDATRNMNSKLRLITDTSDVLLKKKEKYVIHIDPHQAISIINPTKKHGSVKLRLYNHSSNIVQEIKPL